MADKSFKEEKFKKNSRKIKKSSNGYLYGFLFIFLLGYAFFFSSNYWLPQGYKGVVVTPVGETIEQNSRFITVDRWAYCPGKKTMEIIVEMENNSLDDITSYKWQGRDKNGLIKTEIICSDDKFTVIHMSGVKKDWKEVSLTISADNKDFKPIVIYMNDKTATVVKDLPAGAINDYIELAYTSKIESYEASIEDINAKIKENEQLMENAKSRMAELNERKSHQTESEKEETDSLISGLEGQINDKKLENEKNEEDIKELKERIELQKDLLKELKKEE